MEWGRRIIWSPAQDSIIRAHWGKIRAEDIAKKIGKNVTKNMIIGRAHRIDLPLIKARVVKQKEIDALTAKQRTTFRFLVNNNCRRSAAMIVAKEIN